MPLVRQVGKSDIAGELASYNVSDILNGRGSDRGGDCWSRVRMMSLSRGHGFRLAGRW